MRLINAFVGALLVAVILASCGGDSDIPSSHTTINDYSLKLEGTPTSGEQINLVYPESAKDLLGGYALDLEEKNSDGSWLRIARLAGTFDRINKEPVVLPAKPKEDELYPAVGRQASGTLVLQLPDLSSGTYRIVDVLRSTETSTSVALAVEFQISK